MRITQMNMAFEQRENLSLNKQLNSQLLCGAYFVNFGNLGSM